jgi:hypothetical protein
VTAVAERAGVMITEPGVYQLDERAYHADPVPGGSLSASGAKKILPPNCPARFRYERDHPPQPSEEMEFGTAVHKLVLGVGTDVVVVEGDNYRTKAAREARDEARAAGKVPLLPQRMAGAQTMAAAVLSHPLAGALFAPGSGLPEQSLFWTDGLTGIWRRSRLDWLPFPRYDQGRLLRPVIPDLKTCASAEPGAIARAVSRFGYAIQAPWYCDAVAALGEHPDPAFVFVFVESEPPHLITLACLDDDSMAAGRRLGQIACERFRDCTASDVWPAYSEHPEKDIEEIRLPYWALREIEEMA